MGAFGNTWFEIAEFCAKAVAAAPRVEREEELNIAVRALSAHNPQIKIPKQTSRTRLLAYRSQNDIKPKDAAFSRLLRGRPAAAVEVIARWPRRDPVRAKEAA